MNQNLVFIVFCCIFHSVCLISSDLLNNSRTGRIVGGIDVPRTDIGFFCSVFFAGTTKRKHNCGCAIVHAKWAVTSAGCVFDKSYIDITIMAIDKEHPATNIIIHEDYQTSAINNDNDNDISMIEVDMFGDPITLINYKTLNEVEEGTELQLFGFGRLNESDIYPTQVQMLKVKSIELKRCRLIYGENNVADSQLCTLPKCHEGLCFGDIGSPLILKLNGTNYLVGIANTVMCGRGYPDVFANVNHLSEFIDRTIADPS